MDLEAFFAHLPAADLSRSNVTLRALRRRVAVLTAADAPPCELCLWAYRPDPTKTGLFDVAYQVVDTECLVADGP